MKLFSAFVILSVVSFSSCKRSVKIGLELYGSKIQTEINPATKSPFTDAQNLESGPFLRQLF